MKRKQFLNRLLKISQLHDSLNPIREITLLPHKPPNNQDKELIPEPRITKIMPTEASQYVSPQSPQKTREKTHGQKELITSKVLIHTKEANSSFYKMPMRRRMKTTPTHSKLNSSQTDDMSKMLEESFANQEPRYQHVRPRLNIPNVIPHYLEIRQIQPKAFPGKVNSHVNPSKRSSTKNNEIPRMSRMKKHSLTEPTEIYKRESNSQRQNQNQCSKMEISSQNHVSIRSDSFKKYRDSSQYGSREEKMNLNRTKLHAKKEINKMYTKPFMPPPKITAKSYIIYEVKQRREESKVIVAFNSKNSQEVASLTKIMTCIIVIELSQQLCINRQKEEIIIGKLQSSVGGTTASLAQGEVYNVDQLLHGLMLPSGNDASMALAIWAGRKLLEKEQENQFIRFSKMECYNRFIVQMNSKAKELGMVKSNYANSHGLMNQNNRSSAYDIAILCEYAMGNETFRNIVKSKTFKGTIKVSDGEDQKIYKNETEDGSTTDLSQNQRKSPSRLNSLSTSPTKIKLQKTKQVQWQNTHKLLHLKPKEYIGIKTGYTYSAGPCLSSFLTISNRNFIIIVLGCSRVNLRFKETQTLRKWLVRHENLKKKKVKKSGTQLVIDQQQQLEEEQVQFILQNMKADEEKED